MSWAERLRQLETPPPAGRGAPWADRLKEIEANAPTQERLENIDTTPENQGAKNFLMRGQMSLLADTAAEHLAVLRKYHPNADLFRNPDDGEYYFRTVPKEPYRKLDPSIFTDPGRWADLPYDLAELVGILPTAAAEFIAFGLTKNPSALANTATAFIAGIAGETSRQLMQGAVGTQRQSAAEVAPRVFTEGMFGAGGEVASKGVVAGVNMVRGGANIMLRGGAKEAQRSATRLGLPGFTPGQISRSPLIRTLEGQSRALSSIFEERVVEQREAARATLRRIGLQEDPAGATARLSSLVADQERSIRIGLSRPVRSTEAGAALESGVKEWDEAANALVHLKYDHARSLGTPTYDLKSIKSVAEDVAAGRPGQLRSTSSDEVIDYIAEVDPELSDALRQGIKEVEGKVVNLDPAIESRLNRAIQHIKQLDPELPTVTVKVGDSTREVDATDQLLAIRQDLWELKTPQPGERKNFSHWRAERIYNALTDALDNPLLDDDAAAAAWKEARSEAAKRINIWDKTIIRDIAKTQKPAALAQALAAPNKVDEITYLREILPPAKWATFKEYSAGRMVRDPDMYRRMDVETRDALFTAGEQKSINETLDALDMLKADKFVEIARKGYKNRALVNQYLDNAAPAEVDAFLKAVSGDLRAMNDVKSALIDSAIRKAYANPSKPGFKALGDTIDGWADSGITQFFSHAELRSLKNIESYLRFSADSMDVGNRLVTASQVGQLKHFSLQAVGVIVHSIGIGRLLMNPTMQRFLIGTGGKPVNLSGFRAFAATLAASLNEIGRE